MMRRGEHFRFGATLDHSALKHHHDRADVVGDEHIGERQLVLEALQELQNFLGHQLIER